MTSINFKIIFFILLSSCSSHTLNKYSDNSNSNKESIKITIRFLSNEIRSDSLKIIVHKKNCKSDLTSCTINILDNSSIGQELRSSIIKKASLLQKDSKKKN